MGKKHKVAHSNGDAAAAKAVEPAPDTDAAPMDVDASATKAQAPAGTDKPLDRASFLKLFWNLAESDVALRTEAAAQLVSDLLLKQSQAHAKFSEDVQYTLKRLVRGLASSRDAARQGFSTALAGLLEAFGENVVALEQVMTLLNEAMEVRASMKGMEQREHMFGRLFGLLAIHRSGRLQQNADVAVQVVKDLIEISKWKKWMREAAYEGVLAMLVDFPADRFSDVAEELSQHLAGEVSSYNADQVALAAGLHHFLHVHALEETSFPAYQFLSRKKMHLLSEPLKLSSSVYPRVHSAWYGIFGHMMHVGKDAAKLDSELFQEAWTVLVENMLVNPATTTHERRGTAFKVFELVVPSLPRPLLRSILTPQFVKCLYNNSVSKKAILHDAARHCLKVFAQQAPEEFLHFFEHQFAKPLASLVDLENDDSEEVQQERRAQLKKGGFDAIIAIEEEKERAEMIKKKTEGARNWALDHIVEAFNDWMNQEAASDVTSKLSDDILRFLIANAFFKTSQTTNTPTKNKKKKTKAVVESPALTPEPAVSAGTQASCAKRFFSLLSVKLEAEQQSALDRAFGVARELVKERGTDLRHPLDEDTQKAFETAASRVSELRQENAPDLKQDGKQKDAFLMLFMSCGLQLLDNDQRADALGIVEDLNQCFVELMVAKPKKSTPKKKGKKAAAAEEEDKPDSVVVFTDMLLSLLAQDSSAMRDIVTHVFRSMLPLLNTASVQTILNVLAPSEEQANENGNDEEDEEEDEDMEDPAEEEEDIVLSSANDIAEALSSDANLADLHKEDTALAAIVGQVKTKAQRKKDAKRELMQVLHFKLRVVDLLQVYATKCSTNKQVLLLVPALFNAVVGVSPKDTDSRVLLERLHSILMNKLFKAKEVPTLSKGEEQINAVEILEQLMETVMTKSLSKEQVKLGAGSTLYLIRVLCGKSTADNEAFTAVKKILEPAVTECFTKKHSRFPRTLLDEMITRFPSAAAKLLLSVMKDIAATAVEEQKEGARAMDDFSKAETFRLLSLLLKPKTIADEEKLFRLVRVPLKTAVTKALEGHQNLKAKHVKPVLSCALHLVQTWTQLDAKKADSDLDALLTFLSSIESQSPVVKGMVTQILAAGGRAETKTKKEAPKKRKRSASNADAE
ncbi:TPA: hypothetical protein N0F65_003836 [Lagenidium giganteum]|uniref:Uncharacterized protein n=1 Tax=Lagenidium giganteum TaxID=4803 RepID=A0AAV2YQI1_9STRA|nr:TPA: hypothetical protein N0F65_003836 [Lagenidium giganteum]